jgi:hypothetical protein
MTHRLADGSPAHSLSTLMAELATLVRNSGRTPLAGSEAPTFELTTTPSPLHQRALARAQAIYPQSENHRPISRNLLRYRENLRSGCWNFSLNGKQVGIHA